MTDTDKKARESLGRLVDVLVEDVLAASDDEILAEFAEMHGDLAKNSAEMRALFEKSVLKANKDRLREAKAGLAASRAAAPPSKIVSMENVRERLRRTLASCPPNVKLTLAARNENELSDADVLGMLEDLEELGITMLDDESTGQS
jgi:ParB-like chromosome segregation protein Spo0J